jgi:hypothetical protein
MLVVPSCKYFLPTPGSPAWDTNEYAFSTQELLRAYNADGLSLHAEMPIEKDFSPTLAGSSFAADQKQIIDWLQRVPDLIRQSAAPNQVRVGLKMFNAMFDDAFQLHMLQSIALAGNARPDFIVYANRLFDPARNFEGQLGIAVGGPDLSDRNIRVLTQFQNWLRTYPELDRPEISATGDICSGRRAVEYLLRGCRNFQLHTFFQLPADQYPMRHGNKIARALHRLYFDPNEGFIVWALFAAERVGLDSSRPVRVMDLADIHRHGERLDALWAEIDSAIR